MSNFITVFKEGKAGRNAGLTTGITALDMATRGIQKKTSIGLVAAQKVGKCLGLGTKVVMYDLTLKKVEELVVGDILLGLDGKPNKVISTTTGEEMMYWVNQTKAMSYRVNESHILSIKSNTDKVHNISLLDFLNLPWRERTRQSYGYKSAIIKQKVSVPLDPYFLGIWLGDGASADGSITTTDEEVIRWLNEYSIQNGYIFKLRSTGSIEYSLKSRKECTLTVNNITTKYESLSKIAKVIGVLPEYLSRAIVKQGFYEKDGNRVERFQASLPIISILSKVGVLYNKHIPKDYINNSEDIRLSLLAGLIDSDGNLIHNLTSYEITQKSKQLATDIILLANSLGFNTIISDKIASMKRKDGSYYKCKVYRIRIKGNVARIPVKIQRKKAKSLIKNYNSKLTIVKDKVDIYYGFTLENEDRRFYLEDFTVTHNTTMADFCYIISPYLQMLKENRLDDINWICYSFEIDRVSKEYKVAAFFMAHDFGVYTITYKDKVYEMCQDYLEGKLLHRIDVDSFEIIQVTKEHEEMLKIIYTTRIIPMFGEFDSNNRKISSGKIEYIEQIENPTGMYKHLMAYARKNGEFVHETYDAVDDSGKIAKKSRVIGYKENNPRLFTIVIVDHIRKVGEERNFTMKQKIDKWLEYSTILRNLCLFTMINICHSNRGIVNVERLKFAGEFIYPTSDDVKDTGNLGEESTLLITMFNPNDEKYNLLKHFGVEVKNYPKYRSIHIADARYVECPQHIQTRMLGGVNMFLPLEDF